MAGWRVSPGSGGLCRCIHSLGARQPERAAHGPVVIGSSAASVPRRATHPSGCPLPRAPPRSLALMPSEEPNYLAHAFKSQYNLIGWAPPSASPCSAAPASIIVAAGIEMVVLPLVSGSGRFQRLVRARTSEEADEQDAARQRMESSEMLQFMPRWSASATAPAGPHQRDPAELQGHGLELARCCSSSWSRSWTSCSTSTCACATRSRATTATSPAPIPSASRSGSPCSSTR